MFIVATIVVVDVMPFLQTFALLNIMAGFLRALQAQRIHKVRMRNDESMNNSELFSSW